jgi:hypothetical protein
MLSVHHLCLLQVALHAISMAFLVVAGTCGLLIPIMLYGFWLTGQNWQW